MNPKYINKELIKKLNKNENENKQDIILIDQSSNIKENVKDSIENNIYDNSLSIDIKILLPPYYSDIKTSSLISPNTKTKFVYKLGHILNNDLVNTKSNKLIHLCIFNIIENPKIPDRKSVV